MDVFSKVAHALQKVLNDKSCQLATECGFIKRVRKITGANFIKTLRDTDVLDFMNIPFSESVVDWS